VLALIDRRNNEGLMLIRADAESAGPRRLQHRVVA
jgi:hypothetical protein